jgi:hypothetical protein
MNSLLDIVQVSLRSAGGYIAKRILSPESRAKSKKHAIYSQETSSLCRNSFLYFDCHPKVEFYEKLTVSAVTAPFSAVFSQTEILEFNSSCSKLPPHIHFHSNETAFKAEFDA